MGKKRREDKMKRKTQARTPLSGRDMLRVFPSMLLRAFIVVMPLTLLMTFLAGAGVTLFNNFWVQMGAYLAAYIVFNKFIFAPIRNYRPPQSNQQNSSTKAK
jgi:hypothetical protein